MPTPLRKETHITLQSLKDRQACQRGYGWFERNGLDDLPVANLEKITGDYNHYIAWLIAQFSDTCVNEDGNYQVHNHHAGSPVISTYDRRGYLIKRVDKYHVITHTYSADEQVQTSFMSKGRTPVSLIRHPKDTTSRVTRDKNGFLLSTIDHGVITHYRYNKQGDLLSFIDGLGRIVNNQYDDQGNRVFYRDGGTWIRYTYDDRGNELSSTDNNGVTCTRTYDDQDNLLTYTGISGRSNTYTYDDRGNKLSAVNPDGDAYYYTYDSLGNTLTRIVNSDHAWTRTYTNDGEYFRQTYNGKLELEIPLT